MKPTKNINNFANKDNCNNAAFKETHRLKFWIDIAAAIGGIAQVGISVILILTLLAYNKSNETTRESLNLTRLQLMVAQTPWIGIKIDEVKLIDKSWILVTSTLTNHGSGPAVSLNYEFSLEGLKDQFDVMPISSNEFLSPNSYQKATARFIKENAAEIYDKIMSGAVVIRESVSFDDIFGRTFTVTYSIKRNPARSTFDVVSNFVSGYEFKDGT